MSLVERIARAMKDAIDNRDFHDPSDDDWLIAAQAALEAMLEPSEGILKALATEAEIHCGPNFGSGYSIYEDGLLPTWQAAIKAAIAER